MLPVRRRQALRALHATRPGEFDLCRDVESHIHSVSSPSEYMNVVRRAASNLRSNPRLGLEVVFHPDSYLTDGTLVGRIEDQSRLRQQHFEAMLKEKYDLLNDGTFQAIVKCRRCGSHEVQWEEKQTRSADEAATLFCSCVKCKNRWVIK